MEAEIKTKRLILRPLVAADEGALVAALDDLAVSGWLAVVPYPYTPADFREFLAITAPGEHWAICDAGGFVGMIGLDEMLGYWLAAPAWSKGYMTEAGRAVMAAHFAEGGGDFGSGYFAGNARSAGVLGKLGFIVTGQDIKYNRARGREMAHVNMSLTRDAFVAALPVEARSARLSYRALQAVDGEALHGIASQWDVVRQLGSWPWPPEVAFTASRARPFAGRGFVWGAFLDTRLIGTVAVTEDELGYMFAPDCWGQGFATEACSLAISQAFATSDRDHLVAGVWADNAASLCLLGKLGFRVTGDDMTWSVARKVDAPGHALRLDRADWEKAGHDE